MLLREAVRPPLRHKNEKLVRFQHDDVAPLDGQQGPLGGFFAALAVRMRRGFRQPKEKSRGFSCLIRKTAGIAVFVTNSAPYGNHSPT